MFGWLKRKKSKGEEPIKEGRMYDLRSCCWGHKIEFIGDGKKPNTFRVCGWLTPHASNWDTFLFPATKGLAVWLLMDVENCNDPSDMFFGTAGIIRYATEEDLKKVSNKNIFQFV